MQDVFARRSPRSLLALLASFIPLSFGAGCHHVEAPPPGDGEEADGPAQDRPSDRQRCPAGSVIGPDGACMPVGIQGCADLFLDDDNLCHLSMDRCPAGTIPKLDEGCISVGIPSCAPEFLEDDGLCHPRMSKCPAGTFVVPQEGCVPIDGPAGCGSGPWGSIPDRPSNVYVDPSYGGADGDGSRERPLRTVAEALSRVQPGGTVALAAGTYDEPAAITASIELAGRCPSMVRVTGTQFVHDHPSVILVDGASGAAIRGISVEGDANGIFAFDATGLVVERVHIHRTRYAGFIASGGGDATLSRIFVDGVRPVSEGAGYGVVVYDGVTLNVDHAAFQGNQEATIAIAGATTRAYLDGILVEGTAPGVDDAWGMGLVGLEGAQVEVENSAFVDNYDSGVVAQEEGTFVRLSGVLSEGNLREVESATSGNGASARTGSHMTVAGSAMMGNAGFGLVSKDLGSELEVTTTLARKNGFSVGPDETRSGGGGCVAQEQGALTVASSAFVNNHVVALLNADATTSVTGSLMEGSIENGNAWGYGVELQHGRVEISSSAIVGNRFAGLRAVFDADATVSGSLVQGTLPATYSKMFGRAVEVQSQSRVTLLGDAILDNHDVGIFAVATPAGGPPDVTVTGSLVRSTASQELDDRSGVGILVSAAHLAVSSTIVRDNRAAGVALLDGSTGQVSGTSIDGVPGGTLTSPFGDDAFDVGDGVIVMGGSSADLRELDVAGCSRVGVLYASSSGKIEQTRVTSCSYGLVVQGSPQPTVGEGCAFLGKPEPDSTVGADFAVPSTPPAIP